MPLQSAAEPCIAASRCPLNGAGLAVAAGVMRWMAAEGRRPRLSAESSDPCWRPLRNSVWAPPEPPARLKTPSCGGAAPAFRREGVPRRSHLPGIPRPCAVPGLAADAAHECRPPDHGQSALCAARVVGALMVMVVAAMPYPWTICVGPWTASRSAQDGGRPGGTRRKRAATRFATASRAIARAAPSREVEEDRPTPTLRRCHCSPGCWYHQNCREPGLVPRAATATPESVRSASLAPGAPRSSTSVHSIPSNRAT